MTDDAGDATEQELHDELDGLGRLAAAIRSKGSILPEDLGRVADTTLADEELSQHFVIRVLRVVMKLLTVVLRSVRGLFVMATAVAIANTALFITPRLDSTATVVGGVVLFLVMLIPSMALSLLGRRFAAFRESLVLLGSQLSNLGEIPASLIESFAGMSGDFDQIADTGARPRRVVRTARLGWKLSRAVKSTFDQHRDTFDAGMTVTGYGPRDVLLAVVGVAGLATITLLLPVFLMWALFA